MDDVVWTYDLSAAYHAEVTRMNGSSGRFRIIEVATGDCLIDKPVTVYGDIEPLRERWEEMAEAAIAEWEDDPW